MRLGPSHAALYSQTLPQVKEPLLVRDVLYACQGITGKFMEYQASTCSRALSCALLPAASMLAWVHSCILLFPPKMYAASFVSPMSHLHSAGGCVCLIRLICFLQEAIGDASFVYLLFAGNHWGLYASFVSFAFCRKPLGIP